MSHAKYKVIFERKHRFGKCALGCLVFQIFDLDSAWIIKKLEMIQRANFREMKSLKTNFCDAHLVMNG